MLSTEYNLTTAQPMTASSISQQEVACGTDTLPLSPSVLFLSSLQINAGKQAIISQVGHSLQAITRHQIQSMVNIPAFQDKPKQARCSMCNQPKRTACIECLQVYCYDCGRQHLEQLLLQHSLQNTAPKPEEEQTNTPSPITDSTTPTIQLTHNSDSDSDSDDNSDSDGDISI